MTTSPPRAAPAADARAALDGIPGDERSPAPNLPAVAAALVLNVERVVRGRRSAVEGVVVALLAGGHALLEDVPGSGKTTLARAVARSVGASFSRVQATADLLPADITGSGIWDQQHGRFTFVPGPLFAHVVIVDELNRTSPRTQSAFLEAMEEGAVTVDGHRHVLPQPFFVVATQNPFDQHGTYPLPEGQLDRFAVRVRLGALDAAAERAVVREQLQRPTVDALPAVLDPAALADVQHRVREVFVAEPVLEYAVELVRATRGLPGVALGASSRAAIVLTRCAQAAAVLRGREYVVPDDLKAVAPLVLGHRLATVDGGPGEVPVQAALASTPVPVPS